MRASLRSSLLLAWPLLACCEPDHASACDLGDAPTAVTWPVCRADWAQTVVCESGDCGDRGLDVWTHTEPCLWGRNSDQPICVFTDISFAGGRGISFVTTPERARYLASIPAFTDPTNARGLNPPLSGTPEAAMTRTKLYVMREVPGKGMGLVATTFIPRGSLIMANTPSIMTDYRAFNDLTKAQYTTLQAAAASHLPLPHRSLILNLSAHDPAAASTLPQAQLIERIMATNSFDIDPLSDADPDQHYSFFTLFPDIARMNHDCRPNAEYLFLGPSTLAQAVRAARDIYPGEEITLSYLNPLLTRAQRVARLRDTWGFDCTCQACSLRGQLARESDRRVEMIGWIQGELGEWTRARAERSERDDVALAELLVALYEMERLWGSLHEGYVLAALAYNAAGSAWDAVRYARRAVEWGVPMVGEEDEDLKEMATYLNIMAESPPKRDLAKAIEAIREARPPATDTFTYLAIVETNLCPEVLPALHEVLQDAQLTQEIGWDLVYNLVNLPGSDSCLETVARLGNPREVILKVLEALELLGAAQSRKEKEEEEEDDEDDDNEGGEGKATSTRRTQSPADAVPFAHKFITLLGMLAILHKRIRTRHPSRFLAQTLQTVLRTYRPTPDMTAAVVNLVRSLSPPRRRRPQLPTRSSSVTVINLDVGTNGDEGEAASKKNAPDPEADIPDGPGPEGKRPDGLSEDPLENALQQRLLLSFATCILDVYVNANELAWAPRLLEFYNPGRVVPGTRTLLAAFREEHELQARDAIVGRLEALISDLGLASCSKAFVQHICDGPMHSDPLENPDLSSPDSIPLSTGGCVCLVAYWVFSAAVFDAGATRPDPEIHIFPEHFAVLDKFLQDDAHAVIQRCAGTVEALIALGLWLHRAGRISTDPTSPLANPTGSPEDPTSDFMRYTHLATLVALYHPSLRVRDAACTLAAAVLHADPEDDDRLRILEDLLENCMFSTLKARAVAWLSEEIMAASKAEKEQQPQNNLFATPLALETLQYFVFPPLANLVDLDPDELFEHLVTDMPFLLQAVNFALFLWGSSSAKAITTGEEKENPWKHVLPANMEATVRERWFEPLCEAVRRAGQRGLELESEKAAGKVVAEQQGSLALRGGEMEVLKERIGRLEAVGAFPIGREG
ncbi:hypothetical protein VTJ49DRAFT_4896 [Mycothermus thermophilus]|uniref:SET domain-containing protein n=1 Tax=Humicola insolens TaxID=85995 RepID=A0ABR3V4A0_HUMIN